MCHFMVIMVLQSLKSYGIHFYERFSRSPFGPQVHASNIRQDEGLEADLMDFQSRARDPTPRFVRPSVNLFVGWSVTLYFFFINFILMSHFRSFKNILSHSKSFYVILNHLKSFLVISVILVNFIMFIILSQLRSSQVIFRHFKSFQGHTPCSISKWEK